MPSVQNLVYHCLPDMSSHQCHLDVSINCFENLFSINGALKNVSVLNELSQREVGGSFGSSLYIIYI